MSLSSAVCSLVAALAIIVLALGAARRERDTDTLVYGCDRFGYERMARMIREARGTRQPPDYLLHDAQTRWLVERFKESGLPATAWDEAVAPHAHHYFPGTDRVGPQYPPGTGWLLSLFPEVNDVKALNRWTILLVTAGGLGLAAWCAWRGLTASGLVLAGSVATLLSPYWWIRGDSYSINATIGPLFAGTLLAWTATRTRRPWVAAALGLGAGLLFGLLIQVRLASVLLAPAAALLFVPGRWRLLPGFAAGVVLTGIVPVLLHNGLITGSWLGATYNRGDRSQTVASVADNLRFYFGEHAYESGCLHVLGLVVVIGLWLALVAATRPAGAVPAWRSWLAGHGGLVAAPVCAAGLSVAFFLTHETAITYYLVPAMLLTGLLLGLLFVALELHWQKTSGDFVSAGTVRSALAVAAVAVALPTAALSHRALGHMVEAAWENRQDPPNTIAVPPPLLEPRAWVWADVYSSSVIYYHRHPSFKLLFADTPTRLRVFGWIAARGDPQYLVADTDEDESAANEARAAGWRLTPVGNILGRACYRLDPPADPAPGGKPPA